MLYSDFNGMNVSRFGLGTKRMPTEDSKRVVHLDQEKAAEIVGAAFERGINYFATSYSNHKGEAEAFLGEILAPYPRDSYYLSTSFYDIVDPRFDYVFQKQLKKLNTDHIDFYMVENVCDLTCDRYVDSGCVDFLLEQKEKGRIRNLGFSSNLNPGLLKEHIAAYPWDFVSLPTNYYDWFVGGVDKQYEAAKEAGLSVLGHAPFRTGNRSHLRPEAEAMLKEYDPKRTVINWALRFSKSISGLETVSSNMYSVREVEEDCAVFEVDDVLTAEEMELLNQVARAQQTIRPH